MLVLAAGDLRGHFRFVESISVLCIILILSPSIFMAVGTLFLVDPSFFGVGIFRDDIQIAIILDIIKGRDLQLFCICLTI